MSLERLRMAQAIDILWRNFGHRRAQEIRHIISSKRSVSPKNDDSMASLSGTPSSHLKAWFWRLMPISNDTYLSNLAMQESEMIISVSMWIESRFTAWKVSSINNAPTTLCQPSVVIPGILLIALNWYIKLHRNLTLLNWKCANQLWFCFFLPPVCLV